MARRLALLVATYRYQDAGLCQLTAPGHDAEALAEVLRNPEIADFDVTILLNEPHHVVGRAIGEFYRNRRRDDLTLLYFTGHGLKDDQGRLYLAMTNTTRDDLLFTALSAQQIDYAIDSCSSRQKVLVLDCCYSGAFPPGRISKADSQVHALEKFQGKGRVVLTASDSTQYSFEGNHVIGQGTQSVFTRFLVEGLTTGEADLDGDGDISLDELYSYVYDRVVEEMPQQRPKKQENVEGRIVIARNIHWHAPASVRDAIESTFVRDRLAVLRGLAQLHRDGNDLVRDEVINQIRCLIHDENDMVSAAAMELLAVFNREQAPPDFDKQTPPEADEQAGQEAEQSRWVPAVILRPQQAEKQDKKQVVMSSTLLLPINDMTARSGPLERKAPSDLYPARTGGAPEEQVGRDLGLAESGVAVVQSVRSLWNGWWSLKNPPQSRTTPDTLSPVVTKKRIFTPLATLRLSNRRMVLAVSTTLMAIVLLLLSTDLFGGEPKPVALPNVVGQLVVPAEQTLNAVGFQTERRPVKSTPEYLDRVVAMNPPGQAAPGTTIQLEVGAGSVEMVVVPDVVGTNVDQAQRNITGAQLTPQVQEVDSVAPKGQVLRQDPAGGTEVKVGTQVALTVSRGNQLEMPDLHGQAPNQA